MTDTEYDKFFEFEEGEDRTMYPVNGLTRYRLSVKGGVWDTETNKKVPIHEHEEGLYYFRIMHGTQSIAASWNSLFLMTFSPMHLKYETYKKQLKIRVFDKAVRIPNLLNLCWIVPEGGIETDFYKGFFAIPNNPHLVVSKDLKFLRVPELKIVEFKNTDANIYPSIAILNTGWFRSSRATEAVHRLVAFAFIPVPPVRDALWVNHKDGIKNNYEVSNLEWIDPKGNNNHAIATGLRNDNIPLFAYNLLTGEKKSFVSYGECARFLGTVSGVVTGAVMHFRKNKSIKLKPWIITHQSDPVPRLQKNYLDNVAYSQNRFFKVTDKATQEVSYYFKAQDMLDKVGSSRKRMEKYPLRLKDFEINQYVVTDVQEADIPLEVLALKPTYVRGNKPQKRVRVTNLSNNSVVEYDSTDAFASVVGAQRKTIQRGALHNKGIWNGYRLEYLERNIKS